MKKKLYLCVLCAFAVNIFLSWNTSIIPIDGEHDSLRYLEMAEAQYQGKWLGPYNHLTLIRSPVYSGLLSVNRLMNWPLAQMQTCLYLLSVVLLAAALRMMDVPDGRIAAGCILSAFHPAILIACRFVATEAVYTAAVTAALAGAIGVLGSLKKGGWLSWVFWLIILSLSIALAWRVRDESVWLIPAAMVYFGYLAMIIVSFISAQPPPRPSPAGGGSFSAPPPSEGERFSAPPSAGGERFSAPSSSEGGSFFAPPPSGGRLGGGPARWKHIGLLFFCMIIPILSVYLFTTWIQQQNLKHYGVAVVNEMSEPGFKSALSRLTRLDGDSHHPYIPISRKAMAEAERISPHFRMLYPDLSHQLNGSGWSRFGCGWMGICDELAGGWAVWAVRDAANSVGVYADAVTAAAFYADLAKEIETGCRNGSVACTSNPTGNMLAPPIQWIDIPRIAFSSFRVGWMTLWMGDLPEAYRQIAESPPSRELAEKYFPINGGIYAHGSQITVMIHGTLFWLYRTIHIVGGGWLLIFTVILITAWMRPIRLLPPAGGGREGGNAVLTKCYDLSVMFGRTGERRFPWINGWFGVDTMMMRHPVWVMTMVLFFSRLAIVSYIDAMSFWAQSRYMMAVYPAFIMLLCLAFPWRKFPRRRDWTAAPKA